MGYAGTGGGQRLQLVIVEVDAMGIPHVGAGPAQPLQVGKGRRPNRSRVYCSSSLVSATWVCSRTSRERARRALSRSRSVDTEKGSRGQGYLAHGEAGRIVPHPHQPLRVGQNLVDGLYHAVRRQAAVLPGEIHGATGGVEAHAHQLSRPELGRSIPARAGRHSGGRSRWCTPS